jgi:hypothetical protein
MRNHVNHFFTQGWCKFAQDPILRGWVNATLASARATLQDPQQAKWLRYQNTWFAGVNALPNDARGNIANSGPLQGKAVEFIAGALGLEKFAWDSAQISVCYPGYPQPMTGETLAKTRYRRERDAAHVDGLLPEGPERRRHLRELHGFILGIPMVEFNAGASPFVVWEGAHEVMREAFALRFAGLPCEQWGEQDITEVYHAARDRAFAICKRVEIHARPGEAFLAHRLILHGMAPWGDNAVAGADGRMICYFRPDPFGPYEWLNNP